MMKGYRTYLVAALIALVTAVLPLLTDLDWVAVLRGMGVSETWAMPIAGLISAGLMAAMRSITTGPPAGSNDTTGRLSAHAWPIAALAIALMLGGCNTTSMQSSVTREVAMQSAVVAARMVAPSSVAKLDQTIAQVAGSPTMMSACAVFAVAAGYYDTLRPGVSAASQRMGDATSRAGADLCAHPPADTAQALTTLNRLWAGVQAATVVR